MASKREERRRARDQERVERPAPPEQAAKAAKRKGVTDAFCPVCSTWYDSSNDVQVDRHAH